MSQNFNYVSGSFTAFQGAVSRRGHPSERPDGTHFSTIPIESMWLMDSIGLIDHMESWCFRPITNWPRNITVL
jgi:hypothetical protein